MAAPESTRVPMEAFHRRPLAGSHARHVTLINGTCDIATASGRRCRRSIPPPISKSNGENSGKG